MRGSSSSRHLISWSSTTSGAALFSQPVRCGMRTRSELTLKLATVSTSRPLADRERAAAAAGGLGVRVLDLERGADQIFDEIDLGAGQEVERGVVDDDLHPVALEQVVVGLHRVVEREAVLEARAAAARDAEAEHQSGVAFLLDQAGD